MSTMAAPRMVPSAMMKPIFRKGSFGVRASRCCDQPRRERQPMQPTRRAGMAMRAPTIMPPPSVEVEIADGRDRPGDASRAHDQPQRERSPPPDAAAQLPIERCSRFLSVSARRMFATAKPDGNVSCIRSTRIGRVEHADADAEHADAQEVEDRAATTGGSGRPSHTMAWISTRHAAHAGDRGGHGLHVVGAVLAFRPVAAGDRAAQDAGQHLPADEEPEREVHERRGDAAQRAEDEDGHGAEQEVIARRADGRKKAFGLGNGGESTLEHVIPTVETASRATRIVVQRFSRKNQPQDTG